MGVGSSVGCRCWGWQSRWIKWNTGRGQGWQRRRFQIGITVGSSVGIDEGSRVGVNVGELVGDDEGRREAIHLALRREQMAPESAESSAADLWGRGPNVGDRDGPRVGTDDGVSVGDNVGNSVGVNVVSSVGKRVGN